MTGRHAIKKESTSMTIIAITPSKKTVRVRQGDAPPRIETTFGWS